MVQFSRIILLLGASILIMNGLSVVLQRPIPFLTQITDPNNLFGPNSASPLVAQAFGACTIGWGVGKLAAVVGGYERVFILLNLLPISSFLFVFWPRRQLDPFLFYQAAAFAACYAYCLLFEQVGKKKK